MGDSISAMFHAVSIIQAHVSHDQVSPTCAVKCAVLIGVQSDHVSNGPHIVPQHDALGLHHEEIRVGCGSKRE